MSTATEKIPVTCPQCRQQLLVPATALGKQGRCPSCSHVFPLETSIPTTPIEQPVATNAWDDPPAADYALQPQPPHPSPATPDNPYAPPATATDSGKYGHGFGWEHRGWDGGMMGGLAMMAIAAVWFFGGLAIGLRFTYPIILFIIGLVGFFRGLFTGNVSGKQ